jgi:hypothetical protein
LAVGVGVCFEFLKLNKAGEQLINIFSRVSKWTGIKDSKFHDRDSFINYLTMGSILTSPQST